MKRLFLMLPCLLLAVGAFAEDWPIYSESDWPCGQEIKKPDIYQSGIYYQIIGENTLRVISSDGSFMDPYLFVLWPLDCMYYDCLMNGGDYTGDVIIPETVEYSGVTYFVTEIGYGAMVNCDKLTSVTIPKSVNKIYDGAFANTASLSYAVFQGQTPPDIVSDTFGRYRKMQIYVPDGCKKTYEEVYHWNSYLSIKEIGEAGIEAVAVGKSAQLVECDGETVHNLTDSMLYVYGYDGGLKATIAANAYAKLPKGLYIVYGKGHSEKVVVK